MDLRAVDQVNNWTELRRALRLAHSAARGQAAVC
jgi:hypothetical protein